MSQLAFIDDMIARIKDPESSYYAGSAAFLFAALHTAELNRRKASLFSEGWDVELKDLIASGLHGYEMDAVVYPCENPTIDQLNAWVDQYSYFASRIIGLGQDSSDRAFLYSAICLTDALDTMEAKQAEVNGKPNSDGAIHDAYMPVTEEERKEAEDIYNLSLPEITNLEARVALALFHKLLTRRGRYRSTPPVEIAPTIEKIEALFNSTEAFKGEDLLHLAGLAGICFRGTRSSVKNDYAFIDRVLVALSREHD